MTELIKTIVTTLTPNDNGGEAVTVTTKIFDNGDYDETSRYTETEITLHSYGRSASLNLGDVLDHDQLSKHLKKIRK